MSATAITEAMRRNQMGQPAAWTIANNAFPYRYFGVAPLNVRQTLSRRQVPQRSKHPFRASCKAWRERNV
jgi:hypothetical protein